MKKLKSIKYWIFDLDNTLYSGETRVFEQIDKKMSEYISEKLNVSVVEAKEIQKNYFHEYNTTSERAPTKQLSSMTVGFACMGSNTPPIPAPPEI